MAEERMRIALVGYGKMGRAIEELVRTTRGETFEVVSRIDPEVRDADYGEISEESVADTDVCLDFTRPEAALENIRRYADLGKNAVVGTTGWYEYLDKVRCHVKDAGIGVIYASNFSLGMSAFLVGLKEIGKMLAPFGYQVSVEETHHSQKKDRPSGTAKRIAQILRENGFMIADSDIIDHRIGDFVGNHKVYIESSYEKLLFEHDAKNRSVFANGALDAAYWINGRRGFYTIDDMLNDER